jgi:hypothetical protein
MTPERRYSGVRETAFSGKRVCSHTDQSQSKTVVRQSPLTEAWAAEETHWFKSLRSNRELL